MRFHADLHVHSKHSRATSRNLDLENLAYWARRKGIAVVATGDFTHPVWLAELKRKLVPAEPGLFRLQAEIEDAVAGRLPAACRGIVRFMLEVEISTIYKKGELTRKIHHLIYVPDFAAADRLVARLSRVGNLASDGRPILGLDSRHLLEITLEASPDAYLVPAHIWTPWFAALGSRSGFESIAECYGDLADHIFAVETGLSSDPAMNWRVSSLDRFRLVSNSDAHSPGKLGREATAFDTDLDYFAIRRALETGEGYGGTVEFFPDEGKYHLDGHRKCGVRLTPEQTRGHAGHCPACGQPITVGVLHRVEALADRTEAQAAAAPPATAGAVTSLVPLPEVLGEVAGSGPASRTVERRYDRLVAGLGAELAILEAVPLEDIERADSALLAEAIARLRAGRVLRQPGYDGAYGVIRLFAEGELRRRTAGGLLFDVPTAKSDDPDTAIGAQPSAASPRVSPAPVGPAKPTPRRDAAPAAPLAASGVLAALDVDQRAAAGVVRGPLLIAAGPGSGKTRTLTHRIAHLVAECGVEAASCLAITFTQRAAAELRERLAALLPGRAEAVPVHTFHSLGLAILREHGAAAGLHRDFRVADEAERAAALADDLTLSPRKVQALLRAVSLAKRTPEPPADDLAERLHAYQRTLAVRNWVDFDDLVALAAEVLASDAGLADLHRARARWISVDEFQDVDAQQYRLLRLLAPPGSNLCVIGDANQAIYGFRGADAGCFQRFREGDPGAVVIRLNRNYRSTGNIVTAAAQVIAPAAGDGQAAQVVRDMHDRIAVHVARSEHAEAEFVVQAIERAIGGHSFFSIDSGRAAGGARADLSFADFAVLYRTDAQAEALCAALGRSGMPFRKHGHEPLAARPDVKALLDEWERGSGADDARSLRAALRDAADRVLSRRDENGPAVETALVQLTALAETLGDDPRRFAEAIPLARDSDAWDPRADRVALLTLHAAKGLEFPVVFIVGLEDGVLPLTWRPGDTRALEEERRLFYVGMTRARDQLYLCRAEQRVWRGGVRALPPSPYLGDIEAALTQFSRAAAARRKPAADAQLALL